MPRESYDFSLDVNPRTLLNSVRSPVPVPIEQSRPADLALTASLVGLISLPTSGPLRGFFRSVR
ncbi:hypothetical protein ABZ490_33165 [Streptomyces sp. NPDC005811]|uniref:hypothetical protein n=1 Tax=Streptomyces sp. NPDC005811 TaxID=3154565 RepID=UPI0033F8DC90